MPVSGKLLDLPLPKNPYLSEAILIAQCSESMSVSNNTENKENQAAKFSIIDGMQGPPVGGMLPIKFTFNNRNHETTE